MLDGGATDSMSSDRVRLSIIHKGNPRKTGPMWYWRQCQAHAPLAMEA